MLDKTLPRPALTITFSHIRRVYAENAGNGDNPSDLTNSIEMVEMVFKIGEPYRCRKTSNNSIVVIKVSSKHCISKVPTTFIRNTSIKISLKLHFSNFDATARYYTGRHTKICQFAKNHIPIQENYKQYPHF